MHMQLICLACHHHMAVRLEGKAFIRSERLKN